MILKPTSIAEAYSVLGLENGSSLDQVKSSYKQLALRTHPDKNPDNPDATTQFQSVSEAYNVLSKHFERASRGPGHGPRGSGGGRSSFPFGSSSFSYSWGGSDGMDDVDGDGDDEYEYYDSDDEVEHDRFPFFMFLFQEFMRGNSRRQAYSRFYRPRQPSPVPETPEQYQARIRRIREEQSAAEERRTREAAQRKIRQEQVREKERRDAEERQKAKVEAKKADAAAARRKADNAVRTLQQRGQTRRSTIFAAARSGNAAEVKKGVWEDGVDAAGGEVNIGCEEYTNAPKDPKETLLHIAAKNGDFKLVEWLNAHGADTEERNSQGLTAFHVALQHGHSNVVKHFFEFYPPKEADSKHIYTLSPSESLLSLALDSHEPEVVWMILETNGLASAQEIGSAWTRVTSSDGNKETKPDQKASPNDEKFNDIRNLLMRYGGFTPPPTPKGRPSQNTGPSAGERGQPQQPKPKSKQNQRKKAQQNVDLPRPPLGQLPSQSQPANGLHEQQQKKMSGRGRGKGRGKATV